MEDEPPGPMVNMLQTDCLSPVIQIPMFHKEYKMMYPRDGTFYDRLREKWAVLKILTDDEKVCDDLHAKAFDIMDQRKRWGPPAIQGNELRTFLLTKPKPGDIFVNQPSPVYRQTQGNGHKIELFQCLRNSPVHPTTFQFGQTYVYIGFIDMFPLLVSSFIPNNDHGNQKPLTFIGYDKSDIIIARNMVLYQMLLTGMPTVSILQVWFSTGWNERTLQDFKEACTEVLTKMEPTSKNLECVIEILAHWTRTTIRMKSVQGLWSQHLADQFLDPLPNFVNEIDRVEYARYISTGHIFGNSSSDYQYGNLTMFSLPKSCQKYIRGEENFFAALALDELTYNKSLLCSITEKITTGVQRLSENIQRKSIVCKFSKQNVCIKNIDVLQEIRNLNAKVIDWSSIPDFIPADDFFAMAHACSGSQTKHSLHYINWYMHVFGTNIMDYSGYRVEMYKLLMKKRHENYKVLRKSRPYFHPDHYIMYYMNATSEELASIHCKHFLDFVFKDRKVEYGDPILEMFNPFQSSPYIFNVIFSFT